MKILIITGELASNLVKEASLKSDHDVHVHVVKIPIAAFLTPKRIIAEIRTLPANDIYLIPLNKKYHFILKWYFKI